MSPDLEPKDFSRLFTHSFNKYVLSTWYVLDTVPGARNTAVNTADQAIVLLEGTMNQWINKRILGGDMCLDISKASWFDRM